MDKRKKGCGTGVVGVCQWVGVPGGMAPSVQILYLFLKHRVYKQY